MKRVLLLLVPALLLAGCGVTRPGAAAVVDGEKIPQESADTTAVVFCRISLASAQTQGVRAISNAEVRRQAITEMVLEKVADDVARRERLRLPENRTTLPADQQAAVARLVPQESASTVVEVVERSRRLFAITVALGEKATGEKATEENVDDLAQLGRAVVEKELRSRTVRYAPRYGLDADGKQVAPSGSLSTTAEPLTDTSGADVPPSQRCA